MIDDDHHWRGYLFAVTEFCTVVSTWWGMTDERYKDTRCVDADLLVGQIGSQSMGQMGHISRIDGWLQK